VYTVLRRRVQLRADRRVHRAPAPHLGPAAARRAVVTRRIAGPSAGEASHLGEGRARADEATDARPTSVPCGSGESFERQVEPGREPRRGR